MFKTLAALAAFFIAPAQAQQAVVLQCGDRAEMVKGLADKYREAPTAIGVTGGGALLEIFTSDNGATWTALLSRPDGVSCVYGAGEGWRAITPEHGSKI